MNIAYSPIGYFNTPHADVQGMPIQPVGAQGVRGSVSVLPEYVEGLADLDGFSHVIVLYHLHEIRGHQLTVTPFLDTREHGIFIGLSVLQLNGVEGGVVFLENVDVLDGTPVLDIKPYVPTFDIWPATRIGWFEGRSSNAEHHRSDARFAAEPAAVTEE